MLFKAMLEVTRAQRALAHSHPFNLSLCDGSLSREIFFAFLRQDVVYLKAFADAHSTVVTRLEHAEHKAIFQRLADEAYAFESMIHESYLRDSSALPDRFFQAEKPSSGTVLPAVKAYIQHLQDMANHEEVGVAVASLVPCYTLYRELGEVMKPAVTETHGYADWIESYASPEFCAFTEDVVRVMEALAQGKTQAVHDAMVAAFVESTKHELMFWSAFSQPQAEASLPNAAHQVSL